MRRVSGTIAFLLALAGAAQAEPVKLKIASGVLVGEATERANIFKAIPYAAPPVGPLRWAPPKPATPWTGERPAAANGPSCLQIMNADGTPNGGGANGPMSEDCLQLNVFAPKAAKKAPVMVWIHGGSHREGAGWIFDGQNFARDGVVLVTLNYRLGVLGYFAHPALTKAAGPKEPLGSYGQMDQIAALQWVQKNIAAFGGDPRNVTVFGESAGGASTLALLATPSVRGLFQRAIVQSGGGWSRPATLAQREAQGLAVTRKLGLSDAATAADLRALSAERLLAEAPNGFGLFPDGRLMAETPAQAFASGRALDVPLIIGANSGEDSLMGSAERAKATAAALPADMRAAYAQEAALGDEALGREVFGDEAFVAPARWIAAKAAKGKPAWLYHFSYIGSRFRPRMIRAAHAAEIQYVFEYWGRRTPMSVVSDEDRAMAALMHGCWVAFAKMGAPACKGLAWPAYDPAKDELAEFGSASVVKKGFRKGQLDAQERVNLPTLSLPK